MTKELSTNRRIAKNTLALYLRMFLVLGVTLYTSRVVLKTLGVSDFGIFNVVGGFVSMLAYLNSVCVGASQRFISFALGKGDEINIRKTYATAKQIHWYLAIIIIIIAETFGLWFVNTQLIIDSNRMIAANWVYQCSLLSLFISITGIPYMASIVAHEHMHIYAYVSIFDVVLKLLILYLLVVIPADKLIIYALLHVLITLFSRIINTVYCRRHFQECKIRASIDKSLFKEMFSFAGWSALGSLGFSFKDQFSNIILNGFFGTTINASRGIAMQVNGAITSFSDNFFTAVKPQIVKQYAAGNIEQSQKLVYAGARYSFYLLSLISIPVIINMDYILKIWLDIVPEYTADFLVITLLSSLLYSLTTSTSTAIQATGDIKVYQIGVTIIMLLELPSAYLILKMGCKPPMALIPVLFTTFLALVFRFYILKKQISSYSLRRYYFDTVLRCLVIFALSFTSSFFLNELIPINFGGLVISVIMCISLTGIIIYLFGISRNERQMVKRFVFSKLHRR